MRDYEEWLLFENKFSLLIKLGPKWSTSLDKDVL
jgi:hypothetical protein